MEQALRVGDAYALLIEYYVSNRNYEAAYKLLQDMRSRQIVLSPCVWPRYFSTDRNKNVMSGRGARHLRRSIALCIVCWLRSRIVFFVFLIVLCAPAPSVRPLGSTWQLPRAGYN